MVCWQLTLVISLLCLVLAVIGAGVIPVVLAAVIAGVGALASATVNVLAMTVDDRTP